MNIVRALEIILQEAENSINSQKGESFVKNEALALCKQFMEFIQVNEEQIMPSMPDFTPTDAPSSPPTDPPPNLPSK